VTVVLRACFGAAAALAVLTSEPTAKACGVSATRVASCSLAEHREAERPRYAVGLAAGYTSTTLRFDGSIRAAQTRYAMLTELAYAPDRSLVLEAGYGVAFGGSLALGDGKHELSPGPTAFLGADWRVLDEPRYFARLTSVLSFSAARSHLAEQASVPYEAFDLRLGGELGLNLAEFLHPYAVVRTFGGPVYWRYRGRAVTGTDIHHYQIGAGLGLGLGARLSLFAEGIPLGERAVTGGASVAF
jgi:hypothetical protein